MTPAERIAKIRSNRWIRYTRAQTITAQLDALLTHPPTHRMPNLLIVGETNNGKTALIKQFLQRHPPKPGTLHADSAIPVIAVQAPPVPDERRFYQAILKHVYAAFRPSHTAGHLQQEVFRLLSTVQTKMLIIDEIHHILAGPLIKQRHFLNVIKYLGNELQIPIVAVGTPDAFHAIQSDPQLANRFEPVLLPRWTIDEEYLRLLASFESTLQLEQTSGLMHTSLATHILHLSGGTIGEIATLLRHAALVAIERGIEQITVELLDTCGYMSPAQRRRFAAAV
jgi:hypothetical protein